MDYYLDIHLLSDPEFPTPVLMNALYAKMHRALVELRTTAIGVSFPNIQTNHLGNRLRLHGVSGELERLMVRPWLKGMNDHIASPNIELVPTQTTYYRVQRVQTKSSAERLRRRYQKRHPELSNTNLGELIPESFERRLDLPYVRLKSVSSGQTFLLFIKQEVVEQSSPGAFNSYGLSRTATLPRF